MLNRRYLLKQAMVAMAATPALASSALRASPAGRDLAALCVHTRYDATLKATLPRAAQLRIVARSGAPAVAGGAYRWHGAPDGGACFPSAAGGWIYVSNSELPKGTATTMGGVGALRFNAAGEVVDSYPILENTRLNCAGGRSLWGTWLSCEEYGESGLVYECDPEGKKPARARPAMGAFTHEAVAMDPATGRAYLTEDQPNGCLYRFTPARPGDLAEGLLELAVAEGMHLTWHQVPDASASKRPLRYQVPEAARFRGGEGIVYSDGAIYFTTKHDNRVWRLQLADDRLSVVYDATLHDSAVLSGVDNLEIAPGGELLVAEDGGDMQIVALLDDYRPAPLLTLHEQPESEITGPAFSPDGSRLYFSSQRGFSGRSEDGLTYELILP
ncbi:alkaline phosphatase PhoX [Haliea sp. E17]|uniref:alkaline phosphatase PhoX n=1 Tax=Haliea sp. E17 TaxID=3401576 RepID=UPI003AB0A646